MIMSKKKKIFTSILLTVIYAVLCYIMCSVTYNYSEMIPSNMYFVRFLLGMVRMFWISVLPVFTSIAYSKWVFTPKKGHWDDDPNKNLFKCYLPCMIGTLLGCAVYTLLILLPRAGVNLF